jgi:HAMP domain-containing protein
MDAAKCRWRLRVSLKTKLVLATSAVVLALFGISEYLSYSQIAAHLNDWEALLEQSGTRATAIAHLRSEAAFLFEKLAVLWFLTAVITCLMLLLVLNYLWRRLVDNRLNELVTHMDTMSRGSWSEPVHDVRKDEVGNLTAAFNHLGDRLAFTVQQFATASKLSALAIVGQRLVRKVMVVRQHILAIRSLLSVAREHREQVPDAALKNLDAAAESLTLIESEFEQEFQRELNRYIVPASALTARPRVAAAANGGREAPLEAAYGITSPARNSR